jgi:predicted DNA-binding WGR domain protein
MSSPDDVTRYDLDSFSPALKGWLAFLRKQTALGPSRETLALIRDDMPPDLKAWIWTIGRLDPNVEFMIPYMPDLMTGGVSKVEKDFYTGGKRTAFEMLGTSNAVQLTMCAGGISSLIATWKPKDEEMTLCSLANDDVRVTKIGSFQSLFDKAVENLEDKDEEERTKYYEEFEQWVKLVKAAKRGGGKQQGKLSAAPKKSDPKKSDPKESASKKGATKKARYFEFADASSSKFWEMTVAGSSFTARFGKIGTDGQMAKKTFDSAAEAQAAADKLIAEKTKKGYEEK